jgi:hypothetical protein
VNAWWLILLTVLVTWLLGGSRTRKGDNNRDRARKRPQHHPQTRGHSEVIFRSTITTGSGRKIYAADDGLKGFPIPKR